MKKLLTIAALAATMLLTGCMGTIETGNVGVRKMYGKIDQTEVGDGVYTDFVSQVDEYTAKETFVVLQNLTPKAKDKLLMKDLDVTVYYRMRADKIADFASSRAGMSVKFQGEDYYRPGYALIENLAKGTISDEVSKFDSLTLHQNRTDLEAAIKHSLQAGLNESDPGFFEVTRVNINTLLTDPTVEDSIRKNLQMTNETDTAKKAVQKKEFEADALKKTSAALTPELLQYEYIKAIAACATSQHCTLIVGGDKATPLINVPKANP